MKLVILHLSDIHIKTDGDEILCRSEVISRAIFNLIDTESKVVVLISGDISYSGTKEQFELASNFLFSIRKFIFDECSVDVDFVICPGNHDCDFSPNPTRDFMIESVNNSGVNNVPSEVLDSCTSHQKEFFSFRDQFSKEIISEDALWVTQKISFKNKSILFDCINLSWSSKLKEVQGALNFPFQRYYDGYEVKSDLRISVLHHPLNWLSQSSYREFRRTTRTYSDFVFTGHEHIANTISHEDNESGETVIVEGGVLYDSNDTNSSFNVVVIDLLGGNNFSYSFSYHCGDGVYYQDCETKLACKEIVGNKKFRLKQDFIDKIDDCGGYFKHSGTSELKLSDVFIFPTIKSDKDSKKISVCSSKLLSDMDSFSNGIILSGEDNVGCTSLLYRLLQGFVESGYIPVVIGGGDLKNRSTSNVDLQIRRAVEAHYQDDGHLYEAFCQESRSKKIILIDDFDESKVKSEVARSEILDYLSTKFEKVIITVDSMFEVNELTSTADSLSVRYFDHYKVEQFGYLKRTELIQKWYSVGQRDDESEAEVIGKCNMAERLMDTVMDKSLISSNPIFLLTFLQSIETGHSNQLHDGALGHYYNYLLTQSFIDIGIGADSLGQELDYAMHLAYFIYKKKADLITREEFEEFNDYFSVTWHKSDFYRKEQTLIRAKVLSRQDNNYRFRYHYNYYYLLGMYLSQNILVDSVYDDVAHCIKHLYVKDNANIILFLAHHSTSDNILVLMKEATDYLFNENPPADFNGGCAVVHELIKSAPNLVYETRNPKETRREISKRRDESSCAEEVHVQECSEIEQLDLASKITMLFKSIEILCQIIKSNPTKFERIKKVEIIKSVFNAPLRALQDFYNFLEVHPKALVKAINYELSLKSKNIPDEDREKVARLAVSGMIQGISSSFIIKAAQIINSDSLMPDIPTAIGEDSSLAVELIGLAILLDNHRAIDKKKVKDVFLKCKNNLVAQKVLDVIIFHRLSMFKTTEKDMQWLQSELKYDLVAQHRVGYSNKNKIDRIAG